MWEKELWIAKRIKIETNVYGVDIEHFEKPKRYFMHYEPLSSDLLLQEYGEKSNDVYRTFVNKCNYLGVINVGDRVYLSDGATMPCQLKEMAESDNELCNKANYSVVSVLPQNFMIKIDFMKR